jgi:hypothetical protein
MSLSIRQLVGRPSGRGTAQGSARVINGMQDLLDFRATRS